MTTEFSFYFPIIIGIISIISLVISLLHIYYNFLKKRKLRILRPNHIILGLKLNPTDNTYWNLIQTPLTFINNGSREILITNLKFHIITSDSKYSFLWFCKSDEIKILEGDIQELMHNFLFSPFQIEKYSSKTIIIGFITSNLIDLTVGKYNCEIIVMYDKKKILKMDLWIKLKRKDIVNLRDNKITNIYDSFKEKCIGINEKNK